MWNLVPRRQQFFIVGSAYLIVAVAVQGVFGWFGVAARTNFQILSLVASVVGTCLAGLASISWRHVWRWCPWIANTTFPDLTGTWEGDLESNVLDSGGRKKPPRKARLKIRQGLFKTFVELHTSKSHSSSRHCVLELAPSRRTYILNYFYEFVPQKDAKSGTHEGVGRIHYHPDVDSGRLEGCYYTAAHTGGTFSLSRVSESISDTNVIPAGEAAVM